MAGCHYLSVRDRGLRRVVSALTQPHGRMPRQVRIAQAREISRFNPHPARRPDATSDHLHGYRPATVSTLTQPDGRMPVDFTVKLILDDHVSILTLPDGRMPQ